MNSALLRKRSVKQKATHVHGVPSIIIRPHPFWQTIRADPDISLQINPVCSHNDSAKLIISSAHIYWFRYPAAKAIIKCCIAYFIASLFTFVPALAAILSTSSEADAHGRVSRQPAYSAHMVATIVVYVRSHTSSPLLTLLQFNPAKSKGEMLLATRFCAILAILATCVSLLAMGTVELFDLFSPSQGSSWDWTSEIGDWIVCVLWIGGSMGGLAWMKVWVGNPSFNSGKHCARSATLRYQVVQWLPSPCILW